MVGRRWSGGDLQQDDCNEAKIVLSFERESGGELFVGTVIPFLRN
jgi:hypothetical protein